MNPFVHVQNPARIVFGPGRFGQLAAEVDRLGASKVMAIAGEPEAALLEQAVHHLGPRQAVTWNEVRQHVPSDLAERAAGFAAEHDVDLIVTVGGGSTTGLAKALVLQHQVPIIAVPTTYAGSEMTHIWGQTTAGRKTTGRDRAVLPQTVIYDPELTVTLPPHISGASGMNAMAHCVEAVYAPDASPITTSFALQAVSSLATGLPAVVAGPDDLNARADVQFGACLSGMVLATAGIGIHHHICHVLGGMYDLPHADLHTVVLPHAVSAVAVAAPEPIRHIARALGVDDAAHGLYDLAQSMGLPVSLSAIGMDTDQIEAAIPRCVEATAGDVAGLTAETARRLLTSAVKGERPK